MLEKIFILIIALVSMLVMVSCAAKNNDNSNSSANNKSSVTTYDLEEGMNMPNIVVRTNKGNEFDLSKEEKPVLINFWATWCPPCRAEMPGLQKLYDKYSDKIDFIMVNVGESEEEVTKFINENEYTFPIGFDSEGKYATAFKITGIPTTFILDKNKTIKNYLIGARDEKDFNDFIEKVINE